MDETEINLAREAWVNRGQKRPAFAQTPGPGQESVWDYPRPPVLVPDGRRIRVVGNGVCIADSNAAIRVLETASPPTFYLPSEDVQSEYLQLESTHTFCEWKGQASYYSVVVNEICIKNAAWFYPEPFKAFQSIKNYICFYPSRVECYVDNERVRSQVGGFYGGWVTAEIVGPYKGEPGTSDW